MLQLTPKKVHLVRGGGTRWQNLLLSAAPLAHLYAIFLQKELGMKSA
jgi:hypothetical protein